MIKTVVKSNGKEVPFNPEKLNMKGAWADEGGEAWPSIVLDAVSKLQEGCKTSDIDKALIAACTDNFTTDSFKLAGKVLMGTIYKEAYGSFKNIPTLKEHMDKMISEGFWTTMDYSNEELETFNKKLRHDRDLSLNYSEVKQLKDKYLTQDRVRQITLESPQMMYIGMAMANMEKQPKERRVTDVLKLYEYLSRKAINAPTPFMAFLRTPHKNYASCCVATCNDTIPSLSAADHIYYNMTAASAGIGAHLKTRSAGDPIRKGTVEHQGKWGYINAVHAMVKANLQGGRGGAATMHIHALDPEIEMMLKLSNIKTPQERRVMLQFSFGYSRLLAKKVKSKENWMLISYLHAPDLWEASYGKDLEEFERLYHKYDAADVPKKYVPAYDLVLESLIQGVESGRVYQHDTQEMNRHTPFNDPIYSSNLCQEIALPTRGYDNVTDLYINGETSGEIGLCNLAAYVAGRVSDEEIPEVLYYTLLMVDNVISIMEYPFPNLSYTAQARRSIGIGITNLAHDMAVRGYKYSSKEGKAYIHRTMETHSFYLHKASLQLAKEKGVADWIDRTKYPEGWLPVDTYNKNVDKIVDQELIHDWESLRKEIIEVGGIRNSVLEAFMPNESSSIATNGTNSILPIRSLKVVKTNAGKTTKFIVPDAELLADAYELAWKIPAKDLVDVYAIVQKFCGQAISADLYLDQTEGNTPSSQLMSIWIRMVMLGVKTRYYINTKTPSGNKQEEEEDPEVEQVEASESCGGGGCTL